MGRGLRHRGVWGARAWRGGGGVGLYKSPWACETYVHSFVPVLI